MLESAVTVSKTLWSMGLLSYVEVNVSLLDPDPDHCPVREDPSLHVPRYYRDACNPDKQGEILNRSKATTDAFVGYHLKEKRNTYFWARVTICLFCIGAVAFGVAGACIVAR
jgi:hypothetical protein